MLSEKQRKRIDDLKARYESTTFEGERQAVIAALKRMKVNIRFVDPPKQEIDNPTIKVVKVTDVNVASGNDCTRIRDYLGLSAKEFQKSYECLVLTVGLRKILLNIAYQNRWFIFDSSHDYITGNYCKTGATFEQFKAEYQKL